MSPSKHSGRVRGQTLLEAARRPAAPRHRLAAPDRFINHQSPSPLSLPPRLTPLSYWDVRRGGGGGGGGVGAVSGALIQQQLLSFFFSFEDVLCSFFLLLFEREV